MRSDNPEVRFPGVISAGRLKYRVDVVDLWRVMRFVRMLCAARRCFPNLQDTRSPAASCRAPGKPLQFVRTDAFRVKDARARVTPSSARVTPSSARGLCSGSSVRKCWSCGSSAQLFFCSSCKVIQPPHDKATYFQILNWWVQFHKRNAKEIIIIKKNP